METAEEISKQGFLNDVYQNGSVLWTLDTSNETITAYRYAEQEDGSADAAVIVHYPDDGDAFWEYLTPDEFDQHLEKKEEYSAS